MQCIFPPILTNGLSAWNLSPTPQSGMADVSSPIIGTNLFTMRKTVAVWCIVTPSLLSVSAMSGHECSLK